MARFLFSRRQCNICAAISPPDYPDSMNMPKTIPAIIRELEAHHYSVSLNYSSDEQTATKWRVTCRRHGSKIFSGATGRTALEALAEIWRRLPEAEEWDSPCRMCEDGIAEPRRY